MSKINSFATVDGIRLDLISAAVYKNWQTLLKLDDIPIDGNFLLLGGDSIAAVMMMDQIQNVFDVSLSVDEFLSDPTFVGVVAIVSEKLSLLIEQRGAFLDGVQPKLDPDTSNAGNQQTGKSDRDEAMERYIAGQALPIISHLEGPAATCVVQLSDAREGLPFFLVHPVGGTVSCYRFLARGLPEDVPVYGLQSPFIQTGTIDCITLEEICSVYIEAIRAIQPEGPYRIAGWSGGGIFAYEIAQQLSLQNLKVGHVGVIDTSFFYPRTRAETSRSTQLQYVNNNILEFGAKNGDKEISDTEFEYRDAIPPTQEELEASRSQLVNKVQAMLEENKNISRRMTMANRMIAMALNQYVPTVYPGQIVFYRTEMFRAAQQRSGPKDIQWGRVVQGGVDIVDMPGNHVSVVFPPHVYELASLIGKRLASTTKD